jgi:hypothetical protein
LSERPRHADAGASAAAEAPDDVQLRYEEALSEVDRMRDELLRIRHILAASAESEAATRGDQPLPEAQSPGVEIPAAPDLTFDNDQRAMTSPVAGGDFGAPSEPQPMPAPIEVVAARASWKRSVAWGLPVVVALVTSFTVGNWIASDDAPRARSDLAGRGGDASSHPTHGDAAVESGVRSGDAGPDAGPGDSGDGSGSKDAAQESESFTSASGGYGLRYPAAWELDARGEVAVLTRPDGVESVSFALGPPGLPVSYDSFAALLETAYAEVALDEQRATSVAGARAIAVTGRAVNRGGVRLRFEALLVERAEDRSVGVFAARRAGGAPSREALRIMRSLSLTASS